MMLIGGHVGAEMKPMVAGENAHNGESGGLLSVANLGAPLDTCLATRQTSGFCAQSSASAGLAARLANAYHRPQGCVAPPKGGVECISCVRLPS